MPYERWGVTPKITLPSYSFPLLQQRGRVSPPWATGSMGCHCWRPRGRKASQSLPEQWIESHSFSKVGRQKLAGVEDPVGVKQLKIDVRFNYKIMDIASYSCIYSCDMLNWISQRTLARGSAARSGGRGNARASSVASTSGLYCTLRRQKSCQLTNFIVNILAHCENKLTTEWLPWLQSAETVVWEVYFGIREVTTLMNNQPGPVYLTTTIHWQPSEHLWRELLQMRTSKLQ